MGFNNFKGTIMTEFGLMTSLSWFALNNNDQKGPIPTEFGNLVNMTRLSLQDTLISGTIPAELARMTILENLALEFNDLTGDVPSSVCELRSKMLTVFSTDCQYGPYGVNCPVPNCCSFCRRSQKGSAYVNSEKNQQNGGSSSNSTDSAPDISTNSSGAGENQLSGNPGSR
jgi:hypothetical protein